MIITKKQLIQEGILSAVKNNWGKGLLAVGGLAAANAGVFGDKAQKAVEAGGSRTEQFLKDAGDWSKQSMDKMNAKYGKDIDGDGKPSMIEVAKDKAETLNNMSENKELTAQELLDKTGRELSNKTIDDKTLETLNNFGA